MHTQTTCIASSQPKRSKFCTLSLLAAVLFLIVISGVVVFAVKDRDQTAPRGAWIRDPANPVLEAGSEGSWDQNGAFRQTVIKDGATYRMWYVGYDADGDSAIGYATSSNGSTWAKHASNPVLAPGPDGSWDSASIYSPSVIEDGGAYELWYYAYDDNGRVSIGHARSPNGVAWTKDPSNPVLQPGPSGSWDSQLIYAPTVVKRGPTYEMWYQGYDNDLRSTIGRATSTDGTIWTKDPMNPLLEPGTEGAWDDDGVGRPTVLYDSSAGVYRLWYQNGGYNEDAIGYAFSPDGLNWTKYPVNPVLRSTSGDGWESKGVGFPVVVQDGTSYEMWYTGTGIGTYAIGRAVAVPGGSITGEILDDGNAAVPGALIHALDSNLDIVASALSQADGQYRIVDLPAGDYTVEANADGYGREYYDDSYDTAGAVDVSVTVPITVSEIDFGMAPDGAISGQIDGSHGATLVAGARVQAGPVAGGRPLEDTSGPDGTYAIDGLAHGLYHVQASHSSYLADAASMAISVTQSATTTHVDLRLVGPYLPLQIGTGWTYAWSNDTHHSDPITETIRVSRQDEDQYTLAARTGQTHGQFWISGQADGIAWAGFSTHSGSASGFPVPMYMLMHYAYVPYDFLRQPLQVGQTWVGYGQTEASLPVHEGRSTVISDSETVAVTAGTFTDALHVRTVISGTNQYLSGDRHIWFAPGVGLLRLIYNHDDGSVTTAELVGGPFEHHVYLPTLARQYRPSGRDSEM